ncbi:Fur family transcriptional regulator [Bifidobacterium aquikefiri]|uniref:Fur family transcriptional regulator n=2 Tax=Bifidobacterium aquikefiri TaxID=1653207 RepID=UPI0039EB56F4
MSNIGENNMEHGLMASQDATYEAQTKAQANASHASDVFDASQNSTVTKTTTDWRDRLRKARIRVTSQRLAVLSTLEDHPHSSAGEIISSVNAAERENLTAQGTYVILQQLEQYGLVRRVSLPDSASIRWETRVADNHHHVQCVVCGRVEDVDCVVGHAPCLTPSDTHDMEIFEAQIVFRGLCKACKAKIESGAIHKEDLPHQLTDELFGTAG